MKILKTVVALAALAVASSAFAETSLKAFNKLSSDVVEITNDGEETTNTFPGIKNKIKAEVKSDHVDAMVDGVFEFFADTNADGVFQNDLGLKWKGTVKDWYVEARILDDMLTFGFHDEINPEGTKLPIWDDNVAAGNIGSEGFTLVYRPIEGLRLAASLPFTDKETNWLNADGAKEDKVDANTNIRLGAIYDMGIAEFGVAAHDILDSDERSFAGYVYSKGFFGINEGINFRAGFAHSEKALDIEKLFFGEFGISGKNLWNVSFEMPKLLPVGLTLEAAGNTDDAESAYDIYAAAKVDVGINEKLSLAVTGKTGLDLSDPALDTFIEAIVALDINVSKKDKVEVSVDYAKAGDPWALKFPCYWKHTF